MPDKFETVTLPPLSQGMLTLINSVRADDRACIDLLNMEYRLQDEPEARKGMTAWCEEAAATHPFNSLITGLAYFRNTNTHTDGVLLIASGGNLWKSDTSINDRQYTAIQGTQNMIESNATAQFVEYNQRVQATYTPAGYTGRIMLICFDQPGSISSGNITNLGIWNGTGDLAKGPFNIIFGSVVEMNRRIFFTGRKDSSLNILPEELVWGQLGNFLTGSANWSGSSDAASTASEGGYTSLSKSIVALAKTRERLFIFHRDSILQLKFGEPETDQNLFRIEPLTFSGGAVNQHSIVNVLNDLWFLSDMGWVSIQAVEKFGNFEQALVGDKIADLKNIPRLGADGELNTVRAIDFYEKNQCWISIPSAQEAESIRRWNRKCYVMDYHPDLFGVSGTDKRFSRYTGRSNFSSACIATYQGRRRLFVASPVEKEAPVPVLTELETKSSGNMDPGFYYFKIVAVDQYGNQSVPSNELVIEVLSHALDRIEVTWAPVSFASAIRVYKGDTSDGQNLYRETSGSAVTLNWDNDSGAEEGSPTGTSDSHFIIHNVYLTDDKDVLEDDITKFDGTEVSEVITSGFDSKDYAFGNEGIKKEVDVWTAHIKMLASTLVLSISYFFDRDRNKVKTRNFEFESSEASVWDEGEWDEATWSASDDFPEKSVTRRFEGLPGRVFKTIRYRFRCFTGERWGFRGLSMDVAGLDEKDTSDV